MKRARKSLIVAGGLAVLLVPALALMTCGGEHEGPGTVHPEPAPREVIAGRAAEQARRAAELGVDPSDAQILFGDLHVHTTYSPDAFLRSLPLVGGEGAHPPADACDYARYCSALDFYAITDHAEAMTHEHWRETIDSVRECNAVSQDPADPDLAAFVGFEWTQVGASVETHYGHKNVIFRGTSDAELPARPIGADGPLVEMMRDPQINARTVWVPFVDGQDRSRYFDYRIYRKEIAAMPDCPAGVDVHELPLECRELAATPAELFAKLDQWGLDALVIPHGTTWGFYTPPGYLWDKQLAPDQDDPGRQRLIEVYSGHGNSEQWRGFMAGHGDSCPAPADGFEACCWRAGELIRARCGDAPADECEARVVEARRLYIEAGVAGHHVVPGASVEDWANCDQCPDCFNPSYSYRPGGSAQYILARGHFEGEAPPRHVTMGFIASSDNHLARPGTGYKEFGRHGNTEAVGTRAPRFDKYFFGRPERPDPLPVAFDPTDPSVPPFARAYLERQASFFMTGGLVAVHAAGRDHESIWAALQRREVYGTSGERMLLWFDLINEDHEAAMGSAVDVGADFVPRFRVRAAGSFEQLAGCPDWVRDRLPAERISSLCLDECHNPGDQRRPITRVEVVRIRPQRSPEEDISALVEDPWRSLDCPGQGAGCTVEFDDPEFVADGREVLYYVRAIQAPTPAVNAGGVRCEGPECASLDPCYGDYRVDFEDDCLSDNEERAWSSPIWVRPEAKRSESP